MIRGHQKYVRICFSAATFALVAVAIFLFIDKLLFAALSVGDNPISNEACIHCHVSTFNQGMANRTLHAPFMERNCGVCHLDESATNAQTGAGQTPMLTSGMLADQQPKWRKLFTFKEAEPAGFEHSAILAGLASDFSYRFRFVNDGSSTGDAALVERGPWIFLRPAEFAGQFGSGPLVLDVDIAPSLQNLLSSLRLTGDKGTIQVNWRTGRPVKSWIELQEEDGLDLSGLDPASAVAMKFPESTVHPALRSPKDLAIDACYQCHPESSLGTSHPVGLYGGVDVRIPEEIPTVDGMLTCVSCHDPHGAPGEKLVRETIKTKLCVACHYRYKNSSKSTMFD